MDDAIKQIEKKYGKGSVMKLGDRSAVSIDPFHHLIQLEELKLPQSQLLPNQLLQNELKFLQFLIPVPQNPAVIPETTTGGRALKFYSSIRIEIRRSEAIKQGSDIVGNKKI